MWFLQFNEPTELPDQKIRVQTIGNSDFMLSYMYMYITRHLIMLLVYMNMYVLDNNNNNAENRCQW